MAINYDPSKLLKKLVPERRLKRIMKGDLTLKRAALTFIDAIDFLDKKAITDVALKTVRSYQMREAKATVEGNFDRAAGEKIKDELLDDPALLIQRVKNEVIFQIKEKIRDQYAGEKYTWLPSDAEEPDPKHQLNYGKVFTIGEGEMPGDRIGCRCGMEILVNQTELALE